MNIHQMTTTIKKDAECIHCGKPFASFGILPLCEACTRIHYERLAASAIPAPTDGHMMVNVRVDTRKLKQWIAFVTQSSDIFLPSHCGYWLRGVERDSKGWLAFEHEDRKPCEGDLAMALEAWREGRALPPKWFRLDDVACVLAWREGVRMRGEDWYETADAADYDVVLQRALLGEVRYG